MELFLKIIHHLYRRVWRLWNRHLFKQIGSRSYFRKSISLAKESIICGKGVYVWDNARVVGVKTYNNKSFTPTIIIEDYVTIQQNLHLSCAAEVRIGQYTAIAANVTITDIHHSYEDITTPIEYQHIKVSPVFIGPDCKLYNNVVILPGTNIGKHCTVGANSVVSGTYPDFCVIAGAPARIVKQYDPELQQWLKI